MTNKVLVPLDGSEIAAQVLPYTSAFAKATEAELLLLSVVVPIESWLEAAGVSDLDKRLDEETKAPGLPGARGHNPGQDGLSCGPKWCRQGG